MAQTHEVMHRFDLFDEDDLVSATACLESVVRFCESYDGPIRVLHLLVQRKPALLACLPRTVNEVAAWERAVRKLEKLDLFVIVTLSGDAQGLSLDLLLVGDYRTVPNTATLSFTAGDSHLCPGLASYRMISQFGFAVGRKVIIQGEALSAASCLRMGIVDEIIDSGSSAFSDKVIDIAIAASRGIRSRRHLAFAATSEAYDEVLGLHLAACA